VQWLALHRTVVEVWRSFSTDPNRFSPVPGTARAVAAIDLLDDSVDLNPARHVRTIPSATAPAEHAETVRALGDRLHRAAAGLTALSGGASWPPVGAERRSWRSAAVADLLRGGALALLRTPPGRSPREHSPGEQVGSEIPTQSGDVLLPEVLRARALVAHVVDSAEGGRPLDRGMCLLRPDPRRLEPWFLAGFLSAEENVHGAATGTSILRLDVRRLRVPLLPLDEQRRYGQAFRHLHALRQAADLTNRLADDTTRALATGLTTGALSPPDTGRNTGP
jgi:hypothetical protein